MPSANSDSYFFPSDLDAFYFFVCVCMCLIAMARIVNIMINRSGESGHACPVPDLKGKAFSFSPLSLMLTEFVINGFYYGEIFSVYTNFAQSFHHK